MANYRAQQQTAAQKISECASAGKGLRPKLIAQALQRKLDNASGLSAKERAELQADAQAAWISAGKGLDYIEPPDPKNPYGAERHLTTQEQMEINNEYIKQYAQLMQNCASRSTI